jgi:hypothetical protein
MEKYIQYVMSHRGLSHDVFHGDSHSVALGLQ